MPKSSQSHSDNKKKESSTASRPSAKTSKSSTSSASKSKPYKSEASTSTSTATSTATENVSKPSSKQRHTLDEEVLTRSKSVDVIDKLAKTKRVDEKEQNTTGEKRDAGAMQSHGERDESGAEDSTGETERDAAIQLRAYREQLARDLERKESTAAPIDEDQILRRSTTVSPIKEEVDSPAAMSTFSPGPFSAATNVSTESVATIRAGSTPAKALRTQSSYPFPKIGTPSTTPQRPGALNTPRMSMGDSAIHTGSGDRRPSLSFAMDAASPGSTVTFQPGISRQITYTADATTGYPTPNLYDLSLMLTSEPGLEAWWNTVVQIMTAYYKAERIALAIPADSTDLENVPWGQKATYNSAQEDDLSLQAMRRGGSLFHSSVGTISEASGGAEDAPRPKVSNRPGVRSRHSYTAYEDEKRQEKSASASASASRRPNIGSRSKSNFAGPSASKEAAKKGVPVVELNRQALSAHDAEERALSSDEERPAMSNRKSYGRVLPMLQALEYEADPLIDNQGVSRVLERGRVIALTRGYPYLDTSSSHSNHTKGSSHASVTDETKKRVKKLRTDTSTNLSSILSTVSLSRAAQGGGGGHDGDRRPTSNLDQMLEEEGPRRPPTPTYEEVEQTQASAWSQSPAPSPAMRHETSENPFFTDAMVDEDSFNPTSSPMDYSQTGPQEAIGTDNAWTILHIPLKHVLMPKKPQGFRLDASIVDQKSHREHKRRDSWHEQRGARQDSPDNLEEPPTPTPVAILSILTPVIPYPTHLRQSLDHLAPHLATSFSLAQHYSDLEAEVAGLHERRLQTTGFGGVDAQGREIRPLITGGFNDPPVSFTSSITSASEHSTASRSVIGSLTGSPMWETASSRTPVQSPGLNFTDNYFSSMARAEGRRDIARAESQRARMRPVGQGTMSRQSSFGASIHPTKATELATPSAGSPTLGREEAAQKNENTPTAKRERPSALKTAIGQPTDEPMGSPGPSRAGPSKHTKIHTKGADFATTFPNLPPNSSVVAPTTPRRASSRAADEWEMAAPSDRLKSLILDSLPAQVFVASPQNGSIVWVNSRYLTYRGQTVGQLVNDPWGSIHPDDRGKYLAEWAHSVKSGDSFARKVRIRRFDGAYRMFFARAVATRDKSNAVVHILGSYMDIHDQHMLELEATLREEIEASEAKHRLLANLIPQIIFTATEDEGINFANDQWLSYTGKDFEDSTGLGFLDFVHPEDLAKCRIPTIKEALASGQNRLRRGSGSTAAAAAAAAVGGDGTVQLSEVSAANLTELAKQGVVKIAADSDGRPTYSAEIRLRGRDGTYRWHLVRCVQFDNISFGGGESSYFGSATDINDLKLLESQLKVAMESKSRFLSNMSHEIRTPLIGISGMVSFLQDSVLTEEQRDFTNTIQTSANSLLFVINDILDLSKVDAGMMKLNFEWFHTRTLIEDVNELVSTLAIAKGLELNYIIDEDVPLWVKGDRVRVRQILLNIVGNAIKFTQQGEVFCRCKVKTFGGQQAKDAKDIMLDFSVIDTGRGFSEEEAGLMFKPFSQIDGSSTRQHGGSGLGLVISRQLVELHGGKMQGSAVPGKGALFTFTAKFGLPTTDDHPDAALVPATTSTTQHQPLMPSAPAVAEQRPAQMAKPLSFARIMENSPTASPGSIDYGSPPALSSGSSLISVSSSGTRGTQRSSISSIQGTMSRFSDAARASSQDSFRTKLDLPLSRSSSDKTPTQDNPSPSSREISEYRPPMFSILVISPQEHSRGATVKQIEMTLPKGVPSQVTALASAKEAEDLMGKEDTIIFSHIVVNLTSLGEIINLVKVISHSKMGGNRSKTANEGRAGTKIILLSDTIQRQALLRKVKGTAQDAQFQEDKINYLFKPVKLPRFAAIFDPSNERDHGEDQSRSTAQRLVKTQKQSYLDIEKKVGHKGYKVLLVEDNPVNQKVLKKYLLKVGLESELAADGVECTERIFGHEHGFYSLILCDLHMPRKDGYQACREIREWEQTNRHKRMPIIALSANVMSDVQAKCVEAGFSDYVTKPVDFVDLSAVLGKFIED